MMCDARVLFSPLESDGIGESFCSYGFETSHF